MKVQVTQENLNRALGTVSKVANTRNTLPILANILLKTVDNRLFIAATNLEIAMTEIIGAKVYDEGSITVPARLTQDFVSNLPSGTVELESKDNKLAISTASYNSTINGIPADDFPVMPVINSQNKISQKSKDLKIALQQTLLAASSDDTRPVLTAAYLHSHKGQLFVVATDSYRLAEKKLSPYKDDISLLVPAGALNDLMRVLPDNDSEVVINYDEQQVRFSVEGVELITRLIDGNYPDYRKLIPAKFATNVTLTKSELVNITKVSSLFARESAGSITINIDSKAQQINIHSIASQLGENTASAEASVDSDGVVTLNSRYLLEALNAFSGQRVTFSINGKLDPCLLHSEENKDYKHIIMPVKS
jgi:DNA polymerase III subunit beta